MNGIYPFLVLGLSGLAAFGGLQSRMPFEYVTQLECRGHTNVVNAVGWSRDGTRIVSAGWDGTIRTWDSSDGRLIKVVDVMAGNPDKEPPWSTSWSPDRMQAAQVRSRTELIVVDIEKAGVRPILRTAAPITSIGWSPDGRLLAAVEEGKPPILHLTRVTERGESEQVALRGVDTSTCLAWSSDGDRLGIGARNGSIVVCEIRAPLQQKVLKGHTKAVLALSWRPTGNNLWSSSYDVTLRSWEMESGEGKVHARRLFYSLDWSADGRYVAGGSGHARVTVWDLESGRMYRMALPLPPNKLSYRTTLQSLAWSPNGTWLAAGCYDHTVLLSELRRGADPAKEQRRRIASAFMGDASGQSAASNR